MLLNQLKYLQGQGFQVSTISSPGENVSEITKAGIQHIPVNISRSLFSPLSDVLSLSRLVKILSKENFLIVHTHTPKASFLGQIAAKLAGTPIIIRTLHGFYIREDMHPLLRWMIIRLEKIAGRTSDLI
ncbi:MAG: glycosyltransferase, partial [Anaerolineaceae bacterium]|nr:glycosyltransferase [Anaerolineaceae bacterium]